MIQVSLAGTTDETLLYAGRCRLWQATVAYNGTTASACNATLRDAAATGGGGAAAPILRSHGSVAAAAGQGFVTPTPMFGRVYQNGITGQLSTTNGSWLFLIEKL